MHQLGHKPLKQKCGSLYNSCVHGQALCLVGKHNSQTCTIQCIVILQPCPPLKLMLSVCRDIRVVEFTFGCIGAVTWGGVVMVLQSHPVEYVQRWLNHIISFSLQLYLCSVYLPDETERLNTRHLNNLQGFGELPEDILVE